MDPTCSPARSAHSLTISTTDEPRTNAHNRSGSRTEYSPLSSHGMPKEPALLSPDSLVTQPHRFSGLPPSPRPGHNQPFSGLPPSPRPSEPRSPLPPVSPMPALSPSTSGPLSPPMTGKSFGTFIDSEPSTPAYSPQMGSKWDGTSTLMLMPPIKSSDPSPHEPKWDMLVPLQKPPRKRFSRHKPKTSLGRETAPTVPSPTYPAKRILEEPQKENQAPAGEEAEKRDEEEEPKQNDALGKLATRMKSLLKRRSNGEKKEKRPRFEMERVETVHWTEL